MLVWLFKLPSDVRCEGIIPFCPPAHMLMPLLPASTHWLCLNFSLILPAHMYMLLHILSFPTAHMDMLL